MGGETTIDLPGFAVGTDQSKFLAKARAFLRQHLDHVTIAKLRMNKPLTAPPPGFGRTGKCKVKTIQDCFGRKVRLTDERLAHILQHLK